MLNYSAKDHVFVVCAYKENPYLSECLESLLGQNVKSDIFMVTSTPNGYISKLCSEKSIPLSINKGDKGLAQDWNFAIEAASEKKLITIAHQDDIYEKEYLEKILSHINKSKKSLIAFTDYYEIRNSEKTMSNKLLRIKRFMNCILRFRLIQGCKRIRRTILAFGDPICCPSITYVMDNIATPIFDTRFKNGCDYKAKAELSLLKGDFVYIPKPLLGHRIYQDSATTANIQDKSRSQEDFEILSSFWPKWIAKAIHRFYRKAEESNVVE